MNTRNLALVFCILFGSSAVANAGVLADKATGMTRADIVLKTKVYNLPIDVTPQAVILHKCVDGLRIVFTDEEARAGLAVLEGRLQKKYPQAKVRIIDATPGNCAGFEDGNVINFKHDGRPQDPDFFNEVEGIINSIGWGTVVVDWKK